MNFLALLSPTSIMAGVIIALSISNVLFVNLWSNARDDLISYKASVSAAQKQIADENERKLREAAAVNTDIAARLAVALRDLGKRPPVRVLHTNCYTGTGITVPKPPARTDEAPATDAADSAIILTADQCAEKLGDGIEDAVRFAWLIHWVKEQHEVGQK